MFSFRKTLATFAQKHPRLANFFPHREKSMMEDYATRMSLSHGCNDDMDVVESFKEALKQRVGADRYRMWFTHGVDFAVTANQASEGHQAHAIVMLRVRGQFALDRIKNNLLRELRGAAMQACGSAEIEFCLDQPVARQSDLPLPDLSEPTTPVARLPNHATRAKPYSSRVSTSPTSTSRTFTSRASTSRASTSRGKTQSFGSLVAKGAGDVETANQKHRRSTGIRSANQTGTPTQLELPNLVESDTSGTTPVAQRTPATARISAVSDRTYDNFVLGPSNQLAHTAMTMVSQDPRTASPLFVCGPTGTGKSHILSAIADQFRRRHRMRRVMLLSAEQFTNDFISSVGNSGITAFRRRYREVDALLIDGMQFLGAKTATLREMLYTVETIVSSGRPMIASGVQAPSEIQGLTNELVGRLSAGLVCPIQPLDMATRETLLRREIKQRCHLSMPDSTIQQINATLSGDGRVVSGIANLTSTLQRMLGRIPTIDELRRFGGDLLRTSQPVATLSVIEVAVCQAFQLPAETLRGGSQTRAVTEPRMLAMYLSRQLTSSAYTEIARHFGGRSHSTAISAEKNVKKWLECEKSIGRGVAAMSAQEAIDRVESLLRTA